MAKAGKELYVGSLSYDITEYELQKLFSVSGRVTSIHLITDAVTGEFKGCGYVRMSSEAEAKDAIDSLDGAWLLDKQIKVSYANPQKMKPGGGGAKFVPKRRGQAAGEKAAPAGSAPAKAARPAPKAVAPKAAAPKASAPKASTAKTAAAKGASAGGRTAAPKPAGGRTGAAKSGAEGGKRRSRH